MFIADGYFSNNSEDGPFEHANRRFPEILEAVVHDQVSLNGPNVLREQLESNSKVCFKIEGQT
jgi:hypothetical protein